MRNMQNWAHLHAVFSVFVWSFTSHSTWLKAARTCHSLHPHAIHVQRSLSSSPSPSTSSCYSSSSSLSWWPTVTPWQSTTCATPQTGPSSPWTITSSSHFIRPGESRVGSDFCFHKHRETCAGQGPVLSDEFSREAKRWSSVSKHRETCARYREPTGKEEVGLMHISDERCIGKVFKNLRQYLNRSENIDQKTNVLIWGLLMSTTLKAAVHLGQNYNENLVIYWGTPIRRAHDVVRHHAEVDLERWIWDSECFHDWMDIFSTDEIHFITWPSSQVDASWSTRLHLIQFFVWERCTSIQKQMQDGEINFKTCNSPMNTESCLGSMENELSSSGIFPRIHYIAARPRLQILLQFQDKLEVRQTSPEELKIESSSCPCSMILMGQRKKSLTNVFRITKKVKNYSFFGPGAEDKWYGTHNYKPERKWNMIADFMVEKVKESGHPIFRGTSALSRRFLKRIGGRCTIHFKSESPDAELSFRTIHSVNLLSVNGAVAQPICCEDERSVTSKKWFGKKWILWYRHQARRNDQSAGNRLLISRQRFEQLSIEIQISTACESEGFMRRVSIGMH